MSTGTPRSFRITSEVTTNGKYVIPQAIRIISSNHVEICGHDMFPPVHRIQMGLVGSGVYHVAIVVGGWEIVAGKRQVTHPPGYD